MLNNNDNNGAAASSSAALSASSFQDIAMSGGDASSSASSSVDLAMSFRVVQNHQEGVHQIVGEFAEQSENFRSVLRKLQAANSVLQLARLGASTFAAVNSARKIQYMFTACPMVLAAMVFSGIALYTWEFYVNDKDKPMAEREKSPYTAMYIGLLSLLTGVATSESMILKFLTGGLINSALTPLEESIPMLNGCVKFVSNNYFTNVAISYASLYAGYHVINKAVDLVCENAPMAVNALSEVLVDQAKDKAKFNHNPQNHYRLANATIGVARNAADALVDAVARPVENVAKRKIDTLVNAGVEKLKSCKVDTSYQALLQHRAECAFTCFTQPLKLGVNNIGEIGRLINILRGQDESRLVVNAR